MWGPLSDLPGGPIHRPVDMALRTRVRCSYGGRQIGPWHTPAVIASCIHHHIGLCRHVAVHALRTGASRRVMIMLGDIEFRRKMALCAEAVSDRPQLEAVWLVAIRAGDPRPVHAT